MEPMRFTFCRQVHTSARRLAVHHLSRHSALSLAFHARTLQTSSKTPDFAFAFDIDGVLVRGHRALPHAASTLKHLQDQRIPFILLTNGGGYDEDKRAEKLSHELGVALQASNIVQAHTPFAEMHDYKRGTALVVGGEYDNCRFVAEKYGYQTVVTPSDIFQSRPEIWPFSAPLASYHSSRSRPLPAPIPTSTPDLSSLDPKTALKIDSIFVYNDPRDWGLDLALIVDCLMSHAGYIGTTSPKNGDSSLPNRGYQMDGQPSLFFSNPDLWFAAEFVTSRLGQGGFRAALEGVWDDITGGPERGVELKRTVIGKPHHETYEFAERKLNKHRQEMLGLGEGIAGLRKVFMVGDNPESDIRGAMGYKSAYGTEWCAALVETGVFRRGSQPSVRPTRIVKDVREAVEWGMRDSGWSSASIE